MPANVRNIGPQAGPQKEFHDLDVDVAFYGGAAGGGKSFALLLEPLCHLAVDGFNSVVFRRTNPQLHNAGALIDQSFELYGPLRGEYKENRWRIGKADIQFSHMQHEKDKMNWQGAQVAFIGFDELTQFTETQFWYLMSRNRSTCGVRPYIRATCNPDAESWVRKFIDWYVGPDGRIVKDRIGKVRHFTRDKGELIWSGKPQKDKSGRIKSKSFTFIEADLADNPILEKNDPGYKSNLEALPLVERERLLGKNWNIKPGAGKVFNRDWFYFASHFPVAPMLRTWDFAATEKKSADYTATCLSCVFEGKIYMQFNQKRLGPAAVENWFYTTAINEPDNITLWEEEPGSSGKLVAHRFKSYLADEGITGYSIRPQGDKVQRASGLAFQAEQGNVVFVDGPLSREKVVETFHNFPAPGWHDDMIDVASAAWNYRAKAQAGQILVYD